jgi:hypothetical protein
MEVEMTYAEGGVYCIVERCQAYGAEGS